MLDNYLEKLKHKPEHVRRNTALIASGVITGIIVLIWAFSLGSRFGGGDKQASEYFCIQNKIVADFLVWFYHLLFQR